MSFTEIIKLILPLLVISLMLYGLLLLVKRYSFKRINSTWLDIKVINNQMIMPKKFLSVVKVKDKLLILGISDHNITLLKEIDVDEQMLSNNSEKEFNHGFVDIFKKYISK